MEDGYRQALRTLQQRVDINRENFEAAILEIKRLRSEIEWLRRNLDSVSKGREISGQGFSGQGYAHSGDVKWGDVTVTLPPPTHMLRVVRKNGARFKVRAQDLPYVVLYNGDRVERA